jgi:PAS domain S-box-containing protein
VETRITIRLDDYLSELDKRLKSALGDRAAELDEEVLQSVHAAFGDAVRDIIAAVKKGKDVHERFVQGAVLDAVDAIIGTDDNSVIFFWNRGAEATFGYTREEALGRGIDLLSPDTKAGQELAALIRKTRDRGFVRDHRTERRTKSGRILRISISQTLISDDTGAPLGMIAILRDMTEIGELENQLLQNEKLAVIGQIAAGIAHEIGTPLNIISGVAECMQLDRPAGHPEREDLETIIGQTDRIANLIRELLVFSRPQPLRVEAISIEDEIRRVTGLLKGKLDKLQAVCEYEFGIGLPPLPIDANQVQQVFLNLLVNSCDAFEEVATDRRLQLRFTARREPNAALRRDEIVIEVEDNGPGIRPDILGKVFDPFVTTKELGRGTGLGLAVCRRIVGQHHGLIAAENLPGCGTRVTIRLPLHEKHGGVDG